METLASVWAHDPRDLTDLSGETLHKPATVWESQCVFDSSPPAGLMWTEQLSPHLQRNKQLQDTLLQREEELARLQEENNKLREFLSSSFVRNLEEKAKKLSTDGRRKLKRHLMCVDDGAFQTCGHQQQVSKRVCRNLTAEFCSESASSEPNLDLWVLRTLGLKDRDTIDTSEDPLSSPGDSFRSLVYDEASITSSSSSGYTLDSLSPSTPSSSHSYCHSSTLKPGYGFSSAKHPEANHGNPARLALNCPPSQGHCHDFTAPAPTGPYEVSEALTRGYDPFTAFTPSPIRTEVCSITALSPAQTLEGNPARPLYWSSPRDRQTPLQDTIQFSPLGDRTLYSPVSSSSPVANPTWTPVQGGGSASPSEYSQPPVTTPRGREDLAFSMSLSPSSSVKTHSFPQGQAFVRKDTEGRWNFTWVPTQGP